MAISDEEIIEWIKSIKDKCILTWKILYINSSEVNDCETVLDVVVMGKEWYYLLKTILINDVNDCPIISYGIWTVYKKDIWKDTTFLIDNNWINIINLQKIRGIKWEDFWEPPLKKIDWLRIISNKKIFVQPFLENKTCKSNLTEKDYYLNFVLQDYKNVIFNSNYTVYYFWISVIIIWLVLYFIYKKFRRKVIKK